jgi:trk system potassium uptake protein TrkA
VRHFDKALTVGQSDDWTSITRHGEVIIAHHDTVIEADDHVIIFCTRKKLVKKVERLFRVGFTFL